MALYYETFLFKYILFYLYIINYLYLYDIILISKNK